MAPIFTWEELSEVNEDASEHGFLVLLSTVGDQASRYSLVYVIPSQTVATFELYPASMMPRSLFIQCGNRAWWVPRNELRKEVRWIINHLQR